MGCHRAPQRSPPPEASTEGAPPVAMDAPTSSALRAFDMLAVGGRHGGPAPSLPPSPPESPGLFFGRVLTSPVYSGIVIAFCALLVANQWGPAGDEGSMGGYHIRVASPAGCDEARREGWLTEFDPEVHQAVFVSQNWWHRPIH